MLTTTGTPQRSFLRYAWCFGATIVDGLAPVMESTRPTSTQRTTRRSCPRLTLGGNQIHREGPLFTRAFWQIWTQAQASGSFRDLGPGSSTSFRELPVPRSWELPWVQILEISGFVVVKYLWFGLP